MAFGLWLDRGELLWYSLTKIARVSDSGKGVELFPRSAKLLEAMPHVCQALTPIDKP